MSSQFVDINADGFRDIVCGSFSGTPQIIMGSKAGYSDPAPILDADGRTVLISAFWNDETDEWDKTDRAGTEGHCTSAFPVDWDDDGDYDLLLGDYYGGRLYLCKNDGTPRKPAFAAKNLEVRIGKEPVMIESGLAAPEVADWNGDGLFDILLGGSKGGVYIMINKGTKVAPAFAALETLIPPSNDPKKSFIRMVPAKGGQPTGPGSSMHIEACDFDGDGDLDLLVGSRCSWLVKPVKQLTDEEKELLAKAEDSYAAVMKEYRELAGSVGDDKEARKELYDSDEYKAVMKKLREASARMRKYKVDPTKSGDFVWLFRRK